MSSSPPVLEVRDVSKVFAARRRTEPVTAVDSVSLTLHPGESLAVVGESGSGKTTLASMIIGLLEPTTGSVSFRGSSHGGSSGRAARLDRAKQVQMVFQDPYTSLDPRQTGKDGLDELLRIHTMMSRREREARVDELGTQVGLTPGQLSVVPKELSGGQRQRLAITRALAVEPKILVLDEAVSALDVSVQAQLLNLLADIRRSVGLAYIFVSHDLAVVRQVCENAMVMKQGKVVETGSTTDILESPAHPYTQLLIDSVPRRGWRPTRRNRS